MSSQIASLSTVRGESGVKVDLGKRLESNISAHNLPCVGIPPYDGYKTAIKLYLS